MNTKEMALREAAPDLLEALKGATEALGCQNYEIPEAWIAAIKRADPTLVLAESCSWRPVNELPAHIEWEKIGGCVSQLIAAA